ncbi:hypothetical protein MBRA_06291 [Methylobacterium brachiatum]|nr:hypothetical protein MBRA_06291 [Methylobacterium brachiatum]
MIGLAVGVGQRMRAEEQEHQAQLRRYQTAIDEVVEQRDTHATHLIARDHQIAVMWDAMAAILEELPHDHAMVQPTAAIDICGRPMSRSAFAIGSMALDRTLADEYVYFETLRQIAQLVGVRRDQPRAWELRKQLAADGTIETGRALQQALRS